MDQLKNKPQDLLVNTSSGLATDQRRNSTHKNMIRISDMIERHLCTH